MRTEFTELLRVRLPPEVSTAVAEAARKDLTSVSEFARQALIDRVKAHGAPIEPTKRLGSTSNYGRHLTGENGNWRQSTICLGARRKFSLGVNSSIEVSDYDADAEGNTWLQQT